LQKERTRHRNRIRGLLVAQGLRLEPNDEFLQRLEKLTLWDGAPLPLELKGELEREYQRLSLVEAQRRALEKTRKSRLRQADTASFATGRAVDGFACHWAELCVVAGDGILCLARVSEPPSTGGVRGPDGDAL